MNARIALKVCAVLFGLLAISNLSKPLEMGGDVGFVLFGQRLGGTANMVAGPLFGLYLAAYALGIWNLKTYALPMGVVYAAYVLVNLVLWNFRMPPEAHTSLAFGLAYSTIAIGVSAGSAYLLSRNRDLLH